MITRRLRVRWARYLTVCLTLPAAALGCAGREGDPGAGVVGAPTVETLVARHIEARGGRENLEAIETLRMSGRATTGPGREALVSRLVKPPGRIRTEFSFQGVTSVYACDGAVCWYVDPMNGVFAAEPMPPEEAAWSMLEADVFAAIDWQESGHEIELLGTETIDGRDVHELEVTLSSGPSRTVYVDVESALVVRRETRRTIGGSTVDVQTDFGDFRAVNGLVLPHSIRSRAKGSESVLEVIVEAVEINVPLDDSVFEMPAAEPID